MRLSEVEELVGRLWLGCFLSGRFEIIVQYSFLTPPGKINSLCNRLLIHCPDLELC